MDGEYYSMVRHEELRVERDIISGETNIRAVKPGRTFTLRNHPRHKENKKYLLISAEYDMQVAGYSTGTDRQDHFAIKFKALPIDTQFRKKRETPKPKTYGPQTAKVVGPAGEEIWTDKFGRVKVQFHWDRYGQSDENSSCWIRVSSPWAGSGFGGLHIPRIDQEVVVDFIGGNPDRPLIIGRVNNDMNMPLVDLPAKAHTSGFRSKSVHGDTNHENHFLMVDELGKELVDVRAQLDMVINVLRNLDITVGNNLTTLVKGDEDREVKRTRTTEVHGHESEYFHAGVKSRITAAGLNDDVQGGVTRNVNGGNTYTLTGNNTETITGNETYTVNGNQTHQLNGNGTYATTGTRTTTVGADVSDTFGAAWTQTVATAVNINHNTSRNETVNGPLVSLVTGTTTETSNGNWDMIQGGNSIKLTGGTDVTITAPTKITLNAPTVDINDTKHTNQGNQGWSIYSLFEDTKGFELKWRGSTNTFYLQKADIGIYKIDAKVFKDENSGLKREGVITVLFHGAAVLENMGVKNQFNLLYNII